MDGSQSGARFLFVSSPHDRLRLTERFFWFLFRLWISFFVLLIDSVRSGSVFIGFHRLDLFVFWCFIGRHEEFLFFIS